MIYAQVRENYSIARMVPGLLLPTLVAALTLLGGIHPHEFLENFDLLL